MSGTVPARSSVRRAARVFFGATVLGHLSQFVWLAAASRVLDAHGFGQVLTAQVLYAVLQVAVDNGTATVGARAAARGPVSSRDRGELIRIRLVLAWGAVPVGLGVGALSGALTATVPFMAALVGFAVFNVWEPYGSGRPGPWASYMFCRSALPAAAATLCLATGLDFPTALAGGLECLVLAAVALATRQRPTDALRGAAGLRGGPWRATLAIGVPAVLQQGSVAAGTLALSVAGSTAAAGVFAACVRLLTGLNAVNGILATALFPSLASVDGLRAHLRMVALGLRGSAVLGAAASAAACLGAGTIARVLLDGTSAATESALILTTAAGAAMGSTVMLTYVLVAAGLERRVLEHYAVGAGTTVIGTALAAAVSDSPAAVGVALLVGQTVTAVGLARDTGRSIDGYQPVALTAAAAALTIGLIGLAGAATDMETAAGVLLTFGAVGLAASISDEVRPRAARRGSGVVDGRLPATDSRGEP